MFERIENFVDFFPIREEPKGNKWAVISTNPDTESIPSSKDIEILLCRRESIGELPTTSRVVTLYFIKFTKAKTRRQVFNLFNEIFIWVAPVKSFNSVLLYFEKSAPYVVQGPWCYGNDLKNLKIHKFVDNENEIEQVVIPSESERLAKLVKKLTSLDSNLSTVYMSDPDLCGKHYTFLKDIYDRKVFPELPYEKDDNSKLEIPFEKDDSKLNIDIVQTQLVENIDNNSVFSKEFKFINQVSNDDHKPKKLVMEKFKSRKDK